MDAPPRVNTMDQHGSDMDTPIGVKLITLDCPTRVFEPVDVSDEVMEGALALERGDTASKEDLRELLHS